MSDEEKKDENQDQPVEQPAAGVSQATAADAQAAQAVDMDNSVSPLPSGAPAREVHEPQQGTGGDGGRGQDGVQQTESEGAVSRATPDTAPNTHGDGDVSLPNSAQTEQKPVPADGTDTPQDEVTPEFDDLFTVTDESEEEKAAITRVLESHDEYLGGGDIRDPGDTPDVPDAEWESTIGRDYDYYEPAPTLALIRREGRIHPARIEWQGQHPTLTDLSDHHTAISMPSAVYSSIHLPSDVAEYQSARQVFDAVYEVLQNCSALSRQQCELLTFWCIATWFYDAWDFLPRVTVSGPPFAADLLLTLLAYVCSRAIKLIDMSSTVLKEIQMEKLRPTLLIYQTKSSKAATRLLDATDYGGYIISEAGELRQSYSCAKLVYVGETYNPNQNTSGLLIHLSRNASVPAAPYRNSAAVDQLQNQLLSYFAFNCQRTKFLKVPPGELQPELDVIARRLGAVIVNNSALQRRLVELLKGCSEDVRAERSGGIEATVLTATLKLGHGSEPQAYAREIAAGVNQIEKERGESYKLSKEKVGRVLRKLGLRTRHDMNGRALVFDQATQALLHELCLEYDVLPAAPQCGYCHKMQVKEPNNL